MPITFPQEVGLRDARRVFIRPFEKHDADALFSFFLSLPEDTKRGAWDRIETRDVVDSWVQDLDHEKAVSLLAWDATSIVADATLHYRRYGPLRFVGRIKWLIAPEWRGLGVGTALITNFMQMARDNGLKYLTCMLVDGLEDEAVDTLEGMGFKSHRIPAYGVDPDGNERDMVKMVLRL